MIKNLITKTTTFVLSILVLSSTVFFNASDIQAIEETSDNTYGNSMGIVITESNESIAESNTETPDLGDDQAFPFIPGFGKNSGKD